jgi:WD40 repeat protein/NAD(P)-dependent dehydrogenase (short-subunit alcohol dehydrogenase family)
MTNIIASSTNVVVVPVAIDLYDPPPGPDATPLDPLPRIRQDVTLLTELFESPVYRAAGFQVLEPIWAGTAGTVTDRLTTIRQMLAARPALIAILYWSGHGRTVRDNLRLATRECFEPLSISDGLAPGQVVDKLADAKLSALLVLLDVCQAAAASADIVRSATKQSFERSAAAPFGLSALFSAYPFESARDGVFVSALERLLRDGPSAAAFERARSDQWELAFTTHNRRLTPKDVEEALYVEMDIARKSNPSLPAPDGVHSGRFGRIFPNPRFREDAPSLNVEEARRMWFLRPDVETHFLPKARGLEPGEDGWFFCGRREVAREIVDWLHGRGRAGAENLFVLSGQGGTGKSALIGRLVTLSDKGYRAKAIKEGWDEANETAAGTVPFAGAFDGAVHLRGLTAQRVAEVLAQFLGMTFDPSAPLARFVADVPVTIPGEGNRRITVVFDALDESEEPRRISDDLIGPLTRRGWRVLVASRSGARVRQAPDLLARLGSAYRHDLDQETTTQADIEEYVRRRLGGSKESPSGQPEAVVALASAIARRAMGKFLYARITVGGILRRGERVDLDRLDDYLGHDVNDALVRELQELDAAFQRTFDRADDGATALLAALAWSEGDGLPLRDHLWAEVATALAQPLVPYSDKQAAWLLFEAGRFILESGDGEQAVYRLYHQSLSDHFRSKPDVVDLRIRICAALERRVAAMGGWRNANPYLVRHLPTHLGQLADSGPLQRLLCEFDWIGTKLDQLGVQPLLTDYARLRTNEGPAATLQRALKTSAYVLARYPRQLPSQLLGRLSASRSPELLRTLEMAATKAPGFWLRPLGASLATERSMRWLRPGRPETLRNIAFSPRGSAAAYSSGFDEVISFDLIRWEELGPLFPTEGYTFGLAVSDDAGSCLRSDSEGRVQVWSNSRGLVLAGHAHERANVNFLSMSADGQRGLSAGSDGRLVIWDLEAGGHELVWNDKANPVVALGIGGSGNSTVAARRDGSVHLFELSPRGQRRLFVSSPQPTALALSPDGSTVAIATSAGEIEIRAVAAPDRPISTLVNNLPLTALALAPDKRHLAIGAANGTVAVLKVAGGARTALYQRGHTHSVERLVFSEDGTRVLSADSLHVKEWAVESHLQDAKPALPATISDVSVSASTRQAAAILEGGYLGVWNIQTGELDFTLPAFDGHGFVAAEYKGLVNVIMARDAFRVLGWSPNFVCVWDIKLRKQVARLSFAEKVRDVAISGDGSFVVIGAGDGVWIWRVEKGELTRLGEHGYDYVNHVSISRDGTRALSSGGDRVVNLWPLSARKGAVAARPLQVQLYRQTKPDRVAFVDVARSAITSTGGDVCLLEHRTATISVLGTHARGIWSVLATGQPGQIVTSSSDGIMLWDLDAKKRVAWFETHPGEIHQVAPSTGLALIGSPDGVLKIVSLVDGGLVTSFQGDKQIDCAAADADFQWVVARDEGGQMHFFHLENGG